MNLEQRYDFHKSVLDVLENHKLEEHERDILRELRRAIYDMCRCWPCTVHEAMPAVFLGCEFCRVCAEHAHSLDVYAGKR